MPLVVDASIAAKWFVLEPDSERARDVLAADMLLAAPDLLVAEVANVLWKRERAGHIAAEQVDAALAELPLVFGELAPASALSTRAMRIARTLDHPVYDCLYLALSEVADATLVTDDARLARRVAGTPWEARVVTLAKWTAPAP